MYYVNVHSGGQKSPEDQPDSKKGGFFTPLIHGFNSDTDKIGKIQEEITNLPQGGVAFPC